MSDIAYLETLISDDELEKAFGNANFGVLSNRDVIKQGLLKCAGRWHQGQTSRTILKELGLIGKNYTLTKKGGRYLYEAFRGDSNF